MEGCLREVPLIKPDGLPKNPYDLHTWLYQRFCSDKGREFLFATEPDFGPIVIVRSRQLPAIYLDASVLVDIPAAGERRAFCLTASPVARVPDRKEKVRLPPGDKEARVNWLTRQSERHGFELIGTPAVSWQTVVHVRKGERISRESATYQGMLRVTDPERLELALALGIGRSRALGFGLLQLFREH